jgi:hypothetical protein
MAITRLVRKLSNGQRMYALERIYARPVTQQSPLLESRER